MTDLEYLYWLVATAVMIVTVLTVGTLTAAGLGPRRKHSHDKPAPTRLEAAGVERLGPKHESSAERHRDHAA